jgi:exonuclease V gamma subunit
MGNSIGLGVNKEGEVDRCEFTPVNSEMAQQYLLTLIEFMNTCYCQPQPFFLQLALSYLRAEGEKQEEVLDKSLDSEFSELNDEFVQRCFDQVVEEDHVGFLSAQTALWQELLAPLLEHLVNEDDSEDVVDKRGAKL